MMQGLLHTVWAERGASTASGTGYLDSTTDYLELLLRSEAHPHRQPHSLGPLLGLALTVGMNWIS